MVRAAADVTFEQAISFLESQIMTLALTEDAQEGRASFIEMRAPRRPRRCPGRAAATT